MYGVVIAIMLTGASETKLPVLVATYANLSDCRMELVEVSKLPGFERVVSPLFGYAVVKKIEGSTTMAFCVKNIVSI